MVSIYIKASRVGVPYVIDGDEVVPMTHEHVGDLIAIEMNGRGVLSRIEWHIRLAVEEISGISSALPAEDWWQEFNNLLVINELITPLHILQQARDGVENLRGEPDGR
jgi:hypothetical protein